MTGPGCFRLLGEERSIDEGGWEPQHASRLWCYNLHYFADLTARDAGERAGWHVALLRRWVRDNPPARGTGWEPYPTSLRIVNWIKWALAGHELPQECVHSLAIQARWLTVRLERHLLGNHLFVNAKALVFAGLFFDGPEADGWLALGCRIIADELPEQMLADGGHFERSPMYHALALEDLLDLANLRACAGGVDAAIGVALDEAHARIFSARTWLAAMCHPDDGISFFNDAAFGIAPSRRALDDYALRRALPSVPAAMPCVLRESGYVRLTCDAAVALLDVAPVGPDYLPAHAHADTLSFELSVFGRRVLVNSGTSEYGTSAERQRQRGTASHNTVVIDDADSSEVWSGFRVARRARPIDLDVRLGDTPVVACAHDGYRRLPGHPVHRRRWMMSDGMLRVDDEIVGGFGHAESRLHLHPDVSAECTEPGRIALTMRDETRSIVVDIEGGTARIESSTWHPRFGESIASQCLAIRFDQRNVRTTIRWGEP